MHAIKSTRMILGAFALAIGVAGCAAAGTAGSSSSGGSMNRIVMSELDGLEQYDAYAAIQRLRPRWLQSRGAAEPEVYIDGVRRGGLNELRTVRAADTMDIEFMSATDASTRFGTGHSGGAILLRTRR